MMDINSLRKKCQAEKLKAPNRHPFYKIHRIWSIYLTLFFIKVGIKANVISLLMIITGVIGLWIIASGKNIMGITMLYVSFLLDKCDGELARYYNSVSRLGIYIDELYHFFVNSAFFLAIGYNLKHYSDNYVLLGCFVSYLYLLSRSEHKIFYTAIFKLNHSNKEINHTQNKSKLDLLLYWLAVPLQEDIVLLISLILIFFEKSSIILVVYLILLLINVLVNVFYGLYGGFENKCYNATHKD